MPCIEEWLSNPLLVIDNLTADEARVLQVKDYFTQRLSNNGVKRVQSINDKNLDSIKPNSLVRFRCMIQDMFEPEYYLSTYETIERSLLTRGTSSGLYRDTAYCKPGHDVDLSSSTNVTKERYCFYCVPIPGETNWAKKVFASNPGLECNDFKGRKGEVANALKRDYHELEQSDLSNMENNEQVKDNKKVKDESECANRTVNAGTLDLNLPLPDDKGPSCIVKVYGEPDGTYKVNDIVEFIGVFCVDPVLTDFGNQREPNEVHSAVEMEIDEHSPHSLPSSLVPRIHAVVSFKLKHSNPMLDLYTTQPTTLSEMANVRSSILSILEEMLYGDMLAAEYLLLHLISTVYSRPDTLALGKYTLNLIGVSTEVAEQVGHMIEFLVPKFHKLPVTITNLNQSKLLPKKDYQANRLVSGKLQLSDGTHLILDETVLEEGKLDSNGVQNISALNQVVLWQKVQYDFTYYKTDFPTNIVILVLSEGKSLLEADLRVQVEVKKSPIVFASIVQKHPENLFNNVRKYLALARLANYEIQPDTQKHVENDFVQMRQDSPKEMTVDCFHSLLCLARLMAISYGRNQLLKEDWTKVKDLEKLRLSRLSQDTR